MKELPKAYDPQAVESEIYKLWEESGFFNPDNIDSQETYCNILPPPNANGELHLGHASGYAVMDIFGRFARMQGKKTLLFPGKDHAGIQTQVVFEKKLLEEKNIDRHALGREKFYAESYAFCADRSNYMRAQEKRIGISADWSREKFTLDPDVLQNALETFVQMEKDGLIYKGKRIINWCPRCASALADVEVLHEETPGKLYYLKYPLENSAEFIIVATTRPETMLGDSAVAVNPDDARYKNYVGKNIILPLQNRPIKIISDKRIDASFGTGAVKITPAHDPLDWEIGKDHELPEFFVIDEKAEITALGGKYAGLNVHEARKQVIRDLENLNLLEKIEEHSHSVSICERCKTVIEPLTSDQWFVNVDAKNFSLKKSAIRAIEQGDIQIFPENFKIILVSWFLNLKDWCISRQIWWGPQFPVWYCQNCNEEKYIVSLEKPVACPRCNSANLVQDENTFDTWFTSGQWAHTTLKSNEKDFGLFYPSDMMVMGRDLLFFWASRMIMMSLYKTKQAPFKNLFFTGLVRDKEGLKMSKSRDNGIDPILMIDKFGADALRMSLIMDTAPGQDYRLYEEKIETFRNFANKLWNISRFCLTQENFILSKEISDDDIKTFSDQWILNRLNKTIEEMTHLFESKQIGVAADVLKAFTWNDFADWYVEASKLEKNQKILGYVLDKILRLWHPFMPFITEHIWKESGEKTLLMMESWPKVTVIKVLNPDAFEFIKEIIVAIRNARLENNIDIKTKIKVVVDIKNKSIFDSLTSDILEMNKDLIQKLRTGVAELKFTLNGAAIKDAICRAVQGANIYISTEGLVDVEKEKQKYQKETANLEKYIAGIENKLKDKSFLEKAPENIINQQKENLQKAKVKLGEIKKHLIELS